VKSVYLEKLKDEIHHHKNSIIMQNSTPQFRVFKVKFLGPTNHKGARIGISEPRAKNLEGIKSRKVVSYDYAIGNIVSQGVKELEDMGFNVTGYGAIDEDSYIIMCDNWGEDFVEIK